MKPLSVLRTVSWMHKNFIICPSGHMTPEIRLRLLTPHCPLWSAQPDQCPFGDPYWAFYWPGGQALTRYIFDNPAVVRGKAVLDFGSGCGASTIAARLSGASHVTANDIDPVALLSTALNAKLNGLKTSDIIFENRNLLDPECPNQSTWDVILVGDMCYDSEFSSILLSWLRKQKNSKVIIGDPGRHGLANASKFGTLTSVARYSLPDHMTREHYGLSVADIFLLECD